MLSIGKIAVGQHRYYEQQVARGADHAELRQHRRIVGVGERHQRAAQALAGGEGLNPAPAGLDVAGELGGDEHHVGTSDAGGTSALTLIAGPRQLWIV